MTVRHTPALPPPARRPWLSSRQRKFLSYYRPYRHLLLADVGAAFVVSLIALALPLCVRYLTNTVLVADANAALPQLLAVGALMLGLVALHTLCHAYVDHRGHLMGAMMERDMRNELFAHYQKLSFGFYDERQTGQLLSRITHDLFWLSELYHHGPEDLAITLFNLVGVLLISMTISWPLTLVMLLFMLVMGGYAYYFNAQMRVALRQSKERIGDVNAQAEDTLAGIRVVQSFANEALETAKFAHANERFVDSRSAGYRSQAALFSGISAFTNLLTVAVVIFGGVAIVSQALDLADLVTYLLYVGVLIDPVRRLVNFSQLYQEGITGFNRFMDLLEIEPQIQDAPDAVTLGTVRGDIAFEGVSFRYQPQHPPVLHNLSLQIAAGETVALVGPSGVGKTTLCSLIPRFYEVSGGRITLDGVDIRQITLASLRRNIGMVQQDVYLFAGTVAENIRYGHAAATDAAVITAAKQANAHDFIMALPDGYDTDIGQRGVKLSGGQKQRLSIARVFLKNPPILILDEATSALDNASEQAVQTALEALSADRTTLIIAHRLSTVRNAERIVVLGAEGIAEQGSHAALIAADGPYAQLYALQLTF